MEPPRGLEVTEGPRAFSYDIADAEHTRHGLLKPLPLHRIDVAIPWQQVERLAQGSGIKLSIAATNHQALVLEQERAPRVSLPDVHDRRAYQLNEGLR